MSNVSPFIMYPVAAFLVYYGARSFISGVRKEKKVFWRWEAIQRRDWDGFYKNYRYNFVYNVIYGLITFLAGLVILILYRP